MAMERRRFATGSRVSGIVEASWRHSVGAAADVIVFDGTSLPYRGGQPYQVLWLGSFGMNCIIVCGPPV
jgi:hypothetical protein